MYICTNAHPYVLHTRIILSSFCRTHEFPILTFSTVVHIKRFHFRVIVKSRCCSFDFWSSGAIARHSRLSWTNNSVYLVLWASGSTLWHRFISFSLLVLWTLKQNYTVALFFLFLTTWLLFNNCCTLTCVEYYWCHFHCSPRVFYFRNCGKNWSKKTSRDSFRIIVIVTNNSSISYMSLYIMCILRIFVPLNCRCIKL